LAKESPGHILASADAVSNADEEERAHWTLGDSVTLRGHDEPTQLAMPV
jgi:adenylate cyclase